MTDTRSQPVNVNARLLWPVGSNLKRPDASDLVRALDNVSLKGLIKETLLPILWQVRKKTV